MQSPLQMPVINEDDNMINSSSSSSYSNQNNHQMRRSDSSNSHSSSDARSIDDDSIPAVPPRSPRRQKPSQLQQWQEQQAEKLPTTTTLLTPSNSFHHNNNKPGGTGTGRPHHLQNYHHHSHSHSNSSTTSSLKKKEKQQQQQQQPLIGRPAAVLTTTTTTKTTAEPNAVVPSIPYTRSPPPAYSISNGAGAGGAAPFSPSSRGSRPSSRAGGGGGGGGTPKLFGPARYEGPVAPLPKDNRHNNNNNNTATITQQPQDLEEQGSYAVGETGEGEGGEGGEGAKGGGGGGALGVSRRPSWFTSRGGWGRLAVYFAIAAVCVVGLILGLVFGLRAREMRRGDSDIDSTQQKKQPSSSSPPPIFPAGSYRFETALTTADTSCSTSAAAWRCYPYTSYSSISSSSSSSDKNASAATFYWVISEVTDNNGSQQQQQQKEKKKAYTISSSPSLFAPQFSSLPLTPSMTSNDNNDEERPLEFDFVIGRTGSSGGDESGNFTVYPVDPLNSKDSGGGGRVECRYPGTRMRGRIWTTTTEGHGVEFPAGERNGTNTLMTGNSGSTNFDAWPYRVEISQVVDGGNGVPDCVRDDGDGGEESMGEFGVEGQECACRYRNSGL